MLRSLPKILRDGQYESTSSVVTKSVIDEIFAPELWLCHPSISVEWPFE